MAKMSDPDLLAIVSDECSRSLGFEYDNELVAQREQALNYVKGDMSDVPAMANRSKAVSTDVPDAIDTVKPDLMEIFTGGDDVVAFSPTGPEDEEAAKQETDYLNHVFFNENDGWMVLYSFIDDALKLKLGVVKTFWEEGEACEEVFEGKDEQEAAVAIQKAQQAGADIQDVTQDEQGLIGFKLVYPPKGKARVMAVPPEDFTAARDSTLDIGKTTYCAIRTRPRAQELIADGVKRDIVDALPTWGTYSDGAVSLARDTAGEGDQSQAGGTGDLRIVEVIEHYIRIDANGTGKPQLWRVLTGGNTDTLIDKEEVDEVPFAVWTPYIVPHRLYGESMADKLIMIQQIKTVLVRMLLDNGYFALNQRYEVAMSEANEWTISDLLRNEPGVPVRSKSGTAVKAINAGGLSFDVQGAMEYVSTMGEQRTGVMRNAQGLNPDTLHDTAKGALTLLTAAQKRTRMIARVAAETGIKRMFLNLHALLRKHATAASKVRLRNKWVDVDPTEWGERNDMTIEIGLGASGTEAETLKMQQLGALMEKAVMMQGGGPGPNVTADNIYNFEIAAASAAKVKNPERFFSDPKEAPPSPPKPDPEMMKVQAQQQMEQAKLQMQMQSDQAKMQMQAQSDATKAQTDAQMRQMEIQANSDLKREEMAQNFQLKREQMVAELNLKRELLTAELQMKREQTAAELALKEKVSEGDGTSEVEPGGEPG